MTTPELLNKLRKLTDDVRALTKNTSRNYAKCYIN